MLARRFRLADPAVIHRSRLLSGNELTISSECDSLTHQTSLVGQQGKGQRELRSIRSHVSPDAPEVAGPGECRAGATSRSWSRACRPGTPCRPAETKSTKRVSPERWSRRPVTSRIIAGAHQTAAQVVQELSSGRSAVSIARLTLLGIGNTRNSQRAICQSPRPSDPDAWRNCHSARIVIEQFNVSDQGSASEQRLEQIMTEQGKFSGTRPDSVRSKASTSYKPLPV